jgi:hypothetical protein
VPGGAREGAGRPSAFGRGVELHAQLVRMPLPRWAALRALAVAWGLSVSGTVDRLVREEEARRGAP